MNVRALLASPLGFFVGLSLGALGGGGSILAVPVLVYAAGQSATGATTTSLFLVGFASLVGMVDHWRAGRVRPVTGLVFGLSGIGGSLAGSAVNRSIDPDLLLLAFSGLVLLAAWRMVTGCPTCTSSGEKQALAEHGATPGSTATMVRARVDVRTVVVVLAAGTGVGFLTGLFGVGGGFVIVPALALALKMPMPEAVGTSLLVIAVNAAVALSTRLATTSIDWAVTVPFTVAAVAGVISGSKVADRIDAKRTLRWFAALLVGVAVYTATQSAVSLIA